MSERTIIASFEYLTEDALIRWASYAMLDAHKPDLVLASPGFYRAWLWQIEGITPWIGRNWRRIKRERRKFMTNLTSPTRTT